MQWFHFHIGWLNLWVLALVLSIAPLVVNNRLGAKGKASLKRATGLPPTSGVERVFYVLVVLPQFVMLFYSIFVPFTTNAALLGAGLVLFVTGLVLQIKKSWDYAITPPDKLITKGVYQISRNPDYFSATLMYLGMGLAGASWLIIAIAVYWFIGYQWMVTLEEQFCMEHWPDEFPEYKRKVAKNFLFF